jgi:hypothetical protein
MELAFTSPNVSWPAQPIAGADLATPKQYLADFEIRAGQAAPRPAFRADSSSPLCRFADSSTAERRRSAHHG